MDTKLMKTVDGISERLESFVSDSKEHRLEMDRKLDELLKDGKANLVQSIKTNGRVTSLESVAVIHGAAIESFKEMRWWIKGATYIVAGVGALTILVAPIVISYYVDKAVSSSLSKYDIVVEP